MELDPHICPEEIMSREVELSKLDVFCFELSKLFVNSSAADIVFVTVQAQQLKQQLRSAQVAGQWPGTPP